MRANSLEKWLLLLSCSLSLAACNGSKGGEAKREPAALKGLSGRVFDADTGHALAGVECRTPSGETAKTDREGRFTLPRKGVESRIDLSKTSYAATTKEAARDAHVELFLKPVAPPVTFEAERGLLAPLEGGGSVEIPPGAVTDEVGEPVAGMIKLQVASVSGRERVQSTSLPKSQVLGRDGSPRKVGIEYAVDVTLTDSADRRLQLRQGSKVVLELPVKTAYAPEKQSGFSFDEKQGLWVQDADVTRVTDDRGERVYRKVLEHLSWHGYGRLFTELGCLRVCVQRADGAPFAGAQVWVVGSSYAGVSSLFTGSDGCVVGEVPLGQEIVLSAQAGGLASLPLRHVTSDVAESTQDPAACESVAALALTRETSSDCPAGYELCGDTCVDTATDRQHCGGCGEVCGGPAGREQACVAGVCACPTGQTACGDSCVDLQADADHCGGCSNPCVGGDACVAGACTPALACEAGFTRCGRDCVDLSHSEARCGSCETACQAGQLCLNGCVAPQAQTLCSNGASQSCDDGLFCNGTAACNPGSNQALSNGCVLASAPCLAGMCDETLNQCLPPASSLNDAGQVVADAGPGCSPVESQASLLVRPVDVVIAVDTSISIISYFCNLAAGLTGFMNGLGAEARVTTLYDLASLQGACGSGDPLAPSALAQDSTRYRHYQVAIDSFNALDQLRAQHTTYRSFLRPDAVTFFVVVSDDNSSTPAATFRPQMDSLLGHGFVFNAVVADGQNGCMGAAVGSEFLALANQTGGATPSICATPSATADALQASTRSSRETCQVAGVTTNGERSQLFYQPTSGNKSELPRAATAASCGSNLAWYHQGSSMLMCPAACNAARQAGTLTVGNGCPALQL